MSSSFFVEIDELEFVPGADGEEDKPLWVECARWRDGVEEDVTYGSDGEELFTSATGAATLRGFFALRELVLNRCAALFDLSDVRMEDVGDHVVDALESQIGLQLTADERTKLLDTIKAHHHHAGAAERHDELLRKATKRRLAMIRRQRRRKKGEGGGLRGMMMGKSFDGFPAISRMVRAASDHTLSSMGSAPSPSSPPAMSSHEHLEELEEESETVSEMETTPDLRRGHSSSPSIIAEENNIDVDDTDSMTSTESAFERAADFEVEALDVLIGSAPFLTEPFVVFVRLERSCILGDLAEEGYRTRHIFICLGPEKTNDFMWNIGRSFAILASRERFGVQLESATSKEDLAAICTDFLENSFIVPELCSEADPKQRKKNNASQLKRSSSAGDAHLKNGGVPMVPGPGLPPSPNALATRPPSPSGSSMDNLMQINFPVEEPLSPLTLKLPRKNSSKRHLPTSSSKASINDNLVTLMDVTDEEKQGFPHEGASSGGGKKPESPSSPEGGPEVPGFAPKKKLLGTFIKRHSLVRRISEKAFWGKSTAGNSTSDLAEEDDDTIAVAVPMHVARVNRRMAVVRRLNQRQMRLNRQKKKMRWSERDKRQVGILLFFCVLVIGLLLGYMGPESKKDHHSHRKKHLTHMHENAAVVEGLASLSADYPFRAEVDYGRPRKIFDVKLVVQDLHAGDKRRRLNNNETDDRRKVYAMLYDREGAECLKKHVSLELEEEEEAELLKTVVPKLGQCDLGARDGYWELTTTSREPIAVLFQATGLSELAMGRVWASAILLVIVYASIVTDVLHRTLIAMIGSLVALGMLAVLGDYTSIGGALTWINEGTLALLFGMMILVNLLSTTGAFEWLAIRALERSRGELRVLMPLMAFSCATLSAFLDNVTTMLLMAPMTIELCHLMHVDPTPLLISEVLFSNIGGTSTMIGDPPNIIIGNMLSEHVSFSDFIVNLMPCVIIASFPAYAYLRWHYADALRVETNQDLDIEELKRRYMIVNPILLTKASIVLGSVLFLFFLHPLHHVDTAWIAVIGAIALMVVATPHELHAVFEHVEWDTLLFFAALFVMIEALATMGLIRAIGAGVASIVSAAPGPSQLRVAIVVILWISAIVSGFLDNIPYTATMVPVVQALANDEDLNLKLKPLVWALSLGACLGGNLTLVGASANLVTASAAQHAGVKITFIDFMRIGAPVTFITVSVATVYCILVYDVVGGA